jgi:hypothetical protein
MACRSILSFVGLGTSGGQQDATDAAPARRAGRWAGLLLAAGLVFSTMASPARATVEFIGLEYGVTEVARLGSTLYGRAVTTPAGGPWNNLQFNYWWIFQSEYTRLNPFAAGELFLLSQPYTGSPLNLSLATPNVIASTSLVVNIVNDLSSVGVDASLKNAWQFDASVVLQPNTTYYFFMGDVDPAGRQISLFTTPGQDWYVMCQALPTGCLPQNGNYMLENFQVPYALTGVRMNTQEEQPPAESVPAPGSSWMILALGALVARRVFGRGVG